MKLSDLSDNWPRTITIVLLTGFLFWGFSCPARVPSLTHPDKLITRPELQVELDSIIATAEFRIADLDRQEQFRDIIFKNALLMVEGGQLNPLGIITMFASIYGISRGASDIVKKVKKKNSE